MNDIVRLNTIEEYCRRYGVEMQHPLITVINFNNAPEIKHELKSCGFYAVFLKENNVGKMQYGLSQYDYDNGTLVFIAPDQVFGTLPDDQSHKPCGIGLLFHRDIIRDTLLTHRFKDYSFFDYESNEALHMSDHEREQIKQTLANIHEELDTPADENTKLIVVSHLAVLFSHCIRFYNRQFKTRRKINTELLVRFNSLLDSYFSSDLPSTLGLPTVQYCANQLKLSPNYFGDLIKKMTGHTAKDHIQQVTVERIKYLLLNTRKNISEIGYSLGFKYPHHLSRVFKHITGVSPYEYRRMK